MSFNLTWSRRWRIHEHTRVHAPRERTEAVSRRYESTQASRTSTPAGRRRRLLVLPCLPSKGGWKEGAASRRCSTSRSSPTVRPRRPVVLWWFHSVDVTRVHLTMPWVVSFSSLRPFGPRRATAMLRAGEREGTAGERVAGHPRAEAQGAQRPHGAVRGREPRGEKPAAAAQGPAAREARQFRPGRRRGRAASPNRAEALHLGGRRAEAVDPLSVAGRRAARFAGG